MTKIEYTAAVQFGDTVIDAITVAPLTFVALSGLWLAVANEARGNQNANTQAMLQRRRIVHQTSFMASGQRVNAEPAHISQLPIPVARSIIAALDVGEGTPGKVISDGDGISKPIVYKLGNPIETAVNGNKKLIDELEFQAQVYADIEDVLATDGDIPQTVEFLRKVATPLGAGSITTMPTWALDRISVADGVTIMRTVMPRFLE